MDNSASHVKPQSSLILEIHNAKFAQLRQASIQTFTYVHIKNTIQISTPIQQIIVVELCQMTQQLILAPLQHLFSMDNSA